MKSLYTNKTKTFLFTAVVLGAGITIGFLVGGDRQEKNIEDVAGGLMDDQKPYARNDVLESIYRERASSLPDHHTVCIPVKKVFCHDGLCKSDNPAVFDLLSGSGLEQKSFSRCDQKGCDTYRSLVDDSGDYKNIQTDTPKGMLLKMSYNTADKRYLEVATLGLGTFLSSGYCRYVR